MANVLHEGEFYDQYMIILENLSNDIRKRLDLEVTDHALVRLCIDLENELKLGENLYE